MQSLWVVGLIVLALFSGCVGAYVGGYRIAPRGLLARTALSTLAGVVTFAVTAVVAVFIVWPPFLPL